jgi:hypothetical protein
MQRRSTYHRFKVLWATALLVLLFLPMVQQFTGLVEERPLRGAYTLADAPVASVANWFNGDYQQAAALWLNDHVGLRSTLVRVFNQYHYSAFHNARAQAVVIGESGYLYELNYIKAVTGADFIGDSAVDVKVRKLAALTDTLAARGKQVLVVLAPGKGSFYPQYIPAHYVEKGIGRTNYAAYSEALLRHQVPVFDAKLWFESLRETAPYPLFPRTGIHWSRYGEVLVADSLLRLIGGMGAGLEITNVEASRSMRETDDDIEQGMNVLFNLPDLEMGYPEFSLRTHPAVQAEKIITVADSYFWGMYNFGMSRDALGDGSFWFYNEAVYTSASLEPTPADSLDVRAEIEASGGVIFICTDANLSRFAFGFIDRAAAAYGIE